MNDPVLEEALTAFLLGETEEEEITLTLNQQMQFEIEIARSSFRVFAALMHKARWPEVPWDETDLHRDIFEFLHRAFTEPGFTGVINIPPRAGKTQLVCMWVAWCYGHHPDSEFIYASSTQTLSEKSAILIKDIMTQPLYQKIFPKTRINPKVNARDHTKTMHDGTLRVSGTEGQITGFGAGKYVGPEYVFKGSFIFDDLHKVEEARSAIMQEAVKNFYVGTVDTRMNDAARTPIIGIGQRTAMKDIFGYLCPKDGSDSISPRKFEELVIPALRKNPRTGEEESIWPGRWSTEWLQAKRKATPWLFATQYMQQPFNEAGGMFDTEIMPIIPIRPSGQRVAVRSWDLAARELKKGRTEPDYTAKVILAYYPDWRMYVIEDAQLYRAKPEVVRRDMLHTAHRDGREVHITIPKEPSQAGIDQMTNLMEMLDGYKVKPMAPDKDKVTRAEPLIAQFNVGRVACLPHIAELVKREFKPFPDAPHDDLVDALSDAYTFLAIPQDEDEIARWRSLAALRQAGKYEIGPGMTRERNPDADDQREGYLPGEGEI